MPIRIYRKNYRDKLPENTKSVARPSKFGNPFIVGKYPPESYYRYHFDSLDQAKYGYTDSVKTNKEAVRLFKKYRLPEIKDRLKELKGFNLACFCSPEKACHADILLIAANKE
jgi:hypothetical protein